MRKRENFKISAGLGVAQSTIKVNLLLKVLLKLIMNYICCTNGN